VKDEVSMLILLGAVASAGGFDRLAVLQPAWPFTCHAAPLKVGCAEILLKKWMFWPVC